MPALTPPQLTFWGHMTARNLWLSAGVTMLGVAFLVLAGIRLVEFVRGPAVYIVPVGGPALVRPGVISDALAREYASDWVQDRGTFTPETIDAVHTNLRRTLHPSLSVRFEVTAKQEAKEAKQHKMSSQTTVLRSTVLRHAGEDVVVQVDALQTVILGQEKVPEEAVTLTLTLTPWVSGGNPSGILVSRIVEPSPVAYLRR